MEMNTPDTNTPEIRTSNRRGFLRGAAATALGAVGGGLLLSAPAQAVTPPLTFADIPTLRLLNLGGDLELGSDVKVLNYALALEDLEADLYVQALMRLTTGGTNALGKSIPGLDISAMQPDVAYLQQFAPIEAEHRDFLRGSLNSLVQHLAIRPFKYDFALETKSREETLALVLLAETTGVMAYLGAIPYLRTQFFTTAAAAIQGTEARHTAALTIVQNELFNGDNPKPVAPLAQDNGGREKTMSPDEVLAMVSPFIVK